MPEHKDRSRKTVGFGSVLLGSRLLMSNYPSFTAEQSPEIIAEMVRIYNLRDEPKER